MLLTEPTLTTTGIRLSCQGHPVLDLPAEDALSLAKWIRANPQYGYLLEIVRREERTQQEHGEERNL